jgi:hypothetical protein
MIKAKFKNSSLFVPEYYRSKLIIIIFCSVVHPDNQYESHFVESEARNMKMVLFCFFNPMFCRIGCDEMIE